MLPARDLGFALLICLAWAGNFLASAAAVQHFPPILFTALRLLLVLTLLLRFLKPLPRSLWRTFVFVALCNGALHFGFNHWSIAAAGDISSVALSLQSYIPMTAILAWWLLDERPTAMTWLGITVAFAGVAVLAFDPLVLDAPRALVLSLIAAGTLAVGTVLLRRLPGLHPFQVQAWAAAISIPPLLLWSFALEPWSLATIVDASVPDWGGVVYSALAASLIGHGLLYGLLQRHAVAQVTPVLMLTPVFAVALGVLVWGDRPGPQLLIGGVLVLLGVLLVVLKGGRKVQVKSAA